METPYCNTCQMSGACTDEILIYKSTQDDLALIKDLRDATNQNASPVDEGPYTDGQRTDRCHRVLDTVLVDLGLSDAFGKGVSSLQAIDQRVPKRPCKVEKTS